MKISIKGKILAISLATVTSAAVYAAKPDEVRYAEHQT